MASMPAPGLGNGESTTADHETPSSRDVLSRIRLWGPLSRMYATRMPSFLRSKLGWMLPKPTSGRLVVQVSPRSSETAMIEAENVSEYKGKIQRPEGSTSGWTLGIQPNRW